MQVSFLHLNLPNSMQTVQLVILLEKDYMFVIRDDLLFRIMHVKVPFQTAVQYISAAA